MIQKALINGTICTPETLVNGQALLIENNKIAAITDPDSLAGDVEVIDCGNCYIAPGLIDLQIYGGGGYLFSDKLSAEALKSMTKALVKGGTTRFLVTLATNSIEVFREAIQVVKNNPDPSILGIHFEGPYLNPAKRGAHILEYIKPPDRKEIELLLNEAGGLIKMMTLAPELADKSIIKLLTDNGVIVSAGHSNAAFDEALAGFDYGITAATHLFNAMSAFHHRDTGLPGAVFQSSHACASIIADGIHVDYTALSIAKKLLKERLFLITDAVEETLSGPYVHVRQKDRFTLPDGTLSGSALTLLQAVRNCIENAGIPFLESLRMASLYPSKVMGRPDLGRIESGSTADLVVFNKDYEVKRVFVEGEMKDIQ